MNFRLWLEAKDNIVYHATFFKHIPSIAEHGLQPNFNPNDWGGMKSNSMGRNFFSTDLSNCWYWINRLQEQAHHMSDDFYNDSMIPVIIRFRFNYRSRSEPDAHSDLGANDYFTTKTIQPQSIEWYDGKKWKDIQDDDIDYDLFLEWEQGEIDGGWWNFREPYPMPR